MSKEITMNGWISLVPNKMYNSFIKRKFIIKGVSAVSDSDSDVNCFLYSLEYTDKDGHIERCTVKSKAVVRQALKKGMKLSYTVYLVKPKDFEIMNKEIVLWYKKVFEYVELWLRKNNFIKLKRGTFNGGFCVETNPKSEVVTKWGAPLANEGNNVSQIKEKFGRIVVYFNCLTEREALKIKRFAKATEKRYDCITNFN